MSDPAQDRQTRDEMTEDDAVIGVAVVWSLVVLAALAVIGLGLWFALRTPTELREDLTFEIVGPQTRVTEDAVPALPLVDITARSGVDFVHDTGRAGDKLLPETMGSGVAVLDFDGDGHQDLFFVNSKPWPWTPDDGRPPSTCRLYRGDGRGSFRDVSEASGADVSLYGMGVAVGDYDNDGDPDVFLSAVGGNRLLRNDDGVLVDVTGASGVAGDPEAWSTSCGFVDFDNDGLLDLFVGNYVTWDKQADLSQNFTLDGVHRAYGPPRAFRGSFSYLYHNNGDGTFADVSRSAGIQVRNPDTDVPLGKAMGVLPVDFDDDGAMDLVVANDTVRNFLFNNNGDGTFDEVGQLCGIAYDRSGNARGAMGIDGARFRGDGTLAIGIGNFANEASALYMVRPGRGHFVDAAMFTGFGPPTRQGLTFGLFFFDIDLDGRVDILGANGHLEDDIAKTQATQRYAQPPQLFWNAGKDAASELVQVDPLSTGEDFPRPIVGRGAAYGDFDGDGDSDVVITTSGGPPKIFRNDQATGHHYLRLRLVGRECNRDAIGGTATLVVKNQSQTRVVMPTKSYLSQSERELTFGLGDQAVVDTVEVTWPGGAEETFGIGQVDRTVELVQGEGRILP